MDKKKYPRKTYKPKYLIVLFCNGKRRSVFHKYMTQKSIYKYWHEYKKMKPPRFVKMYVSKPKRFRKYELALIFPTYKEAKPKYIEDRYGRKIKVEMNDDFYRIKEIIPFWMEEEIYDMDNKCMITYDHLMDILCEITDIAQIFTLNNKLVLQVEDEVRVFGNKNVEDNQRLFFLIREDLVKNGYGNFIFVRDIDKEQRVELYDMLESKGYSRGIMLKHFSA